MDEEPTFRGEQEQHKSQLGSERGDNVTRTVKMDNVIKTNPRRNGTIIPSLTKKEIVWTRVG